MFTDALFILYIVIVGFLKQLVEPNKDGPNKNIIDFTCPGFIQTN